MENPLLAYPSYLSNSEMTAIIFHLFQCSIFLKQRYILHIMIKAGIYLEYGWKRSYLARQAANVAGEACIAFSPLLDLTVILSLGCTLESPEELEKHVYARLPSQMN